MKSKSRTDKVPAESRKSRSENRDASVRSGSERLRLWLSLHTCAALVERNLRAMLEANFPVTLPQFELMAQLDRNPGSLTMGALSERMMVTNGNVTGIVKRLLAERLVDRETRQLDHRAFDVQLSPSGQALYREMAREHEKWVGQMFANMSPADLDQLMQLLETAEAVLREADKKLFAKPPRSTPAKKNSRPS